MSTFLDDKNQQIELLMVLGKQMSRLAESIDQNNPMPEASLAMAQNPWFTLDNIRYAANYWADGLNKGLMTQWLSPYSFQPTQKTLGLISAGNLPWVGLHDLLCGWLAGYHIQIKLSSKDAVLMKWAIDFLADIDLNWKSRVQVVEKISGAHVVIVTGSNNTIRYFEQYFGHIPHIFRQNRTSVAVLTGQESSEELALLGQDVFRYFGLGCRNVGQIFLPKTMNINTVIEALYEHNDVVNHHKYANNYEYHRALYLLNREPFLDNNFVMFKESDALHSPLGTLYYAYYEDWNALEDQLQQASDRLQCVVSNQPFSKINTVGLGDTQKPKWNDYADHIDVLDFLIENY